MSAILLSNPFVTPPPTAPATSLDQPSTALAVTPAQGSGASSGAGDSTGFSGQGSGYGSDSGQQALLAMTRAASAIGRPADATSGSIVNAQAQAEEAPVIVPFGSNMPEVEMPDILPTAPWFKED
jgi:hypothetical protein